VHSAKTHTPNFRFSGFFYEFTTCGAEFSKTETLGITEANFLWLYKLYQYQNTEKTYVKMQAINA